MTQAPLHGPAVYFVAFTDWDGNALSFAQSLAPLRTKTSVGYVGDYFPYFTTEEQAIEFAVEMNESHNPPVFRVHRINCPYDLVKVLAAIESRSYEWISIDLLEEDGATVVFHITELREHVLSYA